MARSLERMQKYLTDLFSNASVDELAARLSPKCETSGIIEQ